jgi:arabinose-5-phosphate isomerase
MIRKGKELFVIFPFPLREVKQMLNEKNILFEYTINLKEQSDAQFYRLEHDESYKQIIKAKEIILNAERKNKRVHVTGVGKCSYVAGYAASLFSSIGTPAYFLDTTEAVHGSAGQVVAGDVVIAISNSGNTKELDYAISTLKANGAIILAVTGNEESSLASLAEVILSSYVSQEGDSLNKPPRASVIAQMIQLQFLSVLLQEEKHLGLEEYIRWHPGGSLGANTKKELSE